MRKPFGRRSPGARPQVRAGSRTQLGPEAVPLLLALVAWVSLLAAPVENGISRQIETRADVTALETAHDPAAFVAVQKELAVRGLSDPSPPAMLQWWFGSHPGTLRRIAVATAVSSSTQE